MELTRRLPLSVEDVLRKQREEEERANAKPRFMGKAERERLRAEEEAKKTTLAKTILGNGPRADGQRALNGSHNGSSARGDDDRNPSAVRQPGYSNGRSGGSSSHGDRLSYSGIDSDPPRGPRKHARFPGRGNASAGSSSAGAGPIASRAVVTPEDSYQAELEAAKKKYLGVQDGPKHRRRTGDKHVSFDWRPEEDTTVDRGFHTQSIVSSSSTRTDQRGQGSLDERPAQGRDRFVKPYMTPEQKERAREMADEIDAKKGMAESMAKPMTSEVHWTQKPLEKMTVRDWRIFKEDFSISSRGGAIPNPIRKWHESQIPIDILESVEAVGYKEPSPIQRAAIPIGLQGRDLIGIAETGSGKTAAFVIPMLSFIGRLAPFTEENKHLGPYAIILAPTRELAQQIESETRKFAGRLGYACISLVGGRSIEEQAHALQNGAEIIIATPGRLRDCIDRKMVVLSQCNYVVMDEADRMVNLGFEEQLNQILDALPSSNLKPEAPEDEMLDLTGTKKSRLDDEIKSAEAASASLALEQASPAGRYRQTFMFSATMPPAVERLARKYLRRPAVVTIGVAGQAVDSVEQRVEFIEGEAKRNARLLEIVSNPSLPPPVIVFTNQKANVDIIHRFLSKSGLNSTVLHSGKTQEQREAALASLRSGETDILVATDLAGRGIDVPNVSLVVNYEMSSTIEAYIHRIGRTGRAGKRGLAITFLGKDDSDLFYDLKQTLNASPISKCPNELSKHEAAQQRQVKGKRRREDD